MPAGAQMANKLYMNFIRESERSRVVVGDLPSRQHPLGRQRVVHVSLYAISDDGCRHVTTSLAGRFETDKFVEVPELGWIPVGHHLDDDGDVFPAAEVDAFQVRRGRLVRNFNEQFL